MPSNWRYALEPLPVDPDIEKLARGVTAPKRKMADRRGGRTSPPASDAWGERMRRIVDALRTRVTEPDPQAQGSGRDEDPSWRN